MQFYKGYKLYLNKVACSPEQVEEWVSSKQRTYCGDLVFEIAKGHLNVRHSFNHIMNWSDRAVEPYSMETEVGHTTPDRGSHDCLTKGMTPVRSNRGRDRQ